MKKGPIIAIVVAVGLTVVVYMAPKTEEVPVVPATEITTTASDNNTVLLDKKVDEAVEIINNAQGAPMRGIAMLREVIEEDPNHVKANFWLGEFSLMSGQLEKAAPRFEKVLEVDKANAEAATKLVQVYVELQQKEKAKNVVSVFETNNPNHEAIAKMNNILNNI